MQKSQTEELKGMFTLRSIEEPVLFAGRNKAMLASFGALGMLVAVAYVWVSPITYEARWQMVMAKSYFSGEIRNSEDPIALIQRLRPSSSLTRGVRISCGKVESGYLEEYLGKSLKLSPVKGLSDTVEFRLRLEGAERTLLCANTISDMVAEQQRGIIVGRQGWHLERLSQYQAALAHVKKQIDRLSQTEIKGMAYLANHDQMSWLRGRIDDIELEMLSVDKFPARVSAPIEVDSRPITPKWGILLPIGLVLGILFGAIVAVFRERRGRLA